MASYRIPSFPLVANVWRAGFSIPPVGPPALTTPCQLRINRTGNVPAASLPSPATESFLSVPAHTDIRPAVGLTPLPGNGDLVEVPAGSGRYYTVRWIEDVAKGFANEYRQAACIQQKAPLTVP